MALALVVGALLGVLFLVMFLVTTSGWARQRLPDGVRGQGPIVAFSLLGVVASRVVADVTGDGSWLLFWIQLAASLVVIVLLGLPLRRRLRMTELPRG